MDRLTMVRGDFDVIPNESEESGLASNQSEITGFLAATARNDVKFTFMSNPS